VEDFPLALVKAKWRPGADRLLSLKGMVAAVRVAGCAALVLVVVRPHVVVEHRIGLQVADIPIAALALLAGIGLAGSAVQIV